MMLRVSQRAPELEPAGGSRDLTAPRGQGRLADQARKAPAGGNAVPSPSGPPLSKAAPPGSERGDRPHAAVSVWQRGVQLRLTETLRALTVPCVQSSGIQTGRMLIKSQCDELIHISEQFKSVIPNCAFHKSFSAAVGEK